MLYHRRAFTLPELLVVIGVIGVLAAVVLASLGAARSQANDTAIKANLSTIQVQAESFYTSNSNSYGVSIVTGVCINNANTLFKLDSTIKNAIAAIANITGSSAVTSLRCYNWPTSYVVTVKLSDGTFWCVDSLHYSGLRNDPDPFGSDPIDPSSAGNTHC